jgi:hypothetical protein
MLNSIKSPFRLVTSCFSILIFRPFSRAPEQEIGYHGLLIRVERDQPARERVRKILVYYVYIYISLSLYLSI